MPSKATPTRDVYHDCNLCKTMTNSISQYAQHVDDLHRGRRYICHDCKKANKGLNIWNMHNRKNHDNAGRCTIYYGEVFAGTNGFGSPCDDCGLDFEDKIAENHHIEEVHKGRVFECSLCPKIIKSHLDLPIHNSENHEDMADFIARYPGDRIEADDLDRAKAGRVDCRICSSVVDGPSSYYQHHLAAHAEYRRSWLCDKCDYRALTLRDKNNHNVSEHNKRANFRVDYDKSSGHEDGELRNDGRFEKIREQGKKTCQICGRVLDSAAGLKRHMRAHIDGYGKRKKGGKRRKLARKRFDDEDEDDDESSNSFRPTPASSRGLKDGARGKRKRDIEEEEEEDGGKTSSSGVSAYRYVTSRHRSAIEAIMEQLDLLEERGRNTGENNLQTDDSGEDSNGSGNCSNSIEKEDSQTFEANDESSTGILNVETRPLQENESQINCCVCFQAFGEKDDEYRLHLLDHMKDYEGKPVCPDCLVDCDQHERMLDHFLMVHGKVRKLVCTHSDCVLSFRTKRDLELHAESH